MLKRVFDICVSLTGLILLSPVYLAIAIAIKLDSSGPVFFRQHRVGRFGRLFRIHKFRSMHIASQPGGSNLTIGLDPRITSVGGIIRKYKLDELPQLIDVLVGNMSLVGPRPEVPQYVAEYPENERQLIQSMRPGITDLASIEFRSESEILARSDNPHEAYVQEVLPVKLKYYTDYVRTHTFIGDIRIILDTIHAIVRSRGPGH